MRHRNWLDDGWFKMWTGSQNNIRIISGIFGFLDPGRGRHQMEDSSGDNQAEGADTATTRHKEPGSLPLYWYSHSGRRTLGRCPQLWRRMYPSCENILLTRNYFHWGTTVTVSLCFLITSTSASVRIVTTRGEGKLMCGCGLRPGVEMFGLLSDWMSVNCPGLCWSPVTRTLWCDCC